MSPDEPHRARVQDSESRRVGNQINSMATGDHYSLTTIDASLRNTVEGTGWRGNHREQIGDGTTLDFLFRNPTGTGKVAFLNIAVNSDGVLDIETFRHPTVDTEGSAIQMNTRLVPASDADEVDLANFDVFQGGTYTGGTRALQGRNHGQTTGANRGSQIGDTATYAFEPGGSMRMTVTSREAENVVIVRTLVDLVDIEEVPTVNE